MSCLICLFVMQEILGLLVQCVVATKVYSQILPWSYALFGFLPPFIKNHVQILRHETSLCFTPKQKKNMYAVRYSFFLLVQLLLHDSNQLSQVRRRHKNVRDNKFKKDGILHAFFWFLLYSLDGNIKRRD